MAEGRKSKTRVQLTPKKTVNICAKFTERRTVAHEYKIEPKMYEVLKENETLRRQLVTLKVN
jgi:hypothetical protein